jgi:predicted metal-dependent hydrolase
MRTVEERSARLAGGNMPYLLRRSARSRGLRVTIDRALGVVVSVPLASRRGWTHPEREVERFLVEREAWLRRHLDRQARERASVSARGPLGDGALVPYRGELHRVRVVAAPGGGRRTSVTREPAADGPTDELVVRLAAGERRTLSAILVASLRARARVAIDRELARHAPALSVEPALVTIRDTRSRWGSVSRRHALSFSWRLVLAPPEALETVVVHELAHLRVFGHGPRFWALVASRRPDHLTWRRWLREHSYELHAAFAEPDASIALESKLEVAP